MLIWFAFIIMACAYPIMWCDFVFTKWVVELQFVTWFLFTRYGFFFRFANYCFRLTQSVMWKNEGMTCFVITFWWHQQKCIWEFYFSKKKSLMNLNVNVILKWILFEWILMYTVRDLSNRDLVQYWLQNCSYFINVTAFLKTIVFDAYLLKTFLINEICVNNTYRT